MASTRTLIASLGAGCVLVGAAALSLLILSAVFAFGGWSGPLSKSAEKPALVFAEPSGPDTAGTRRIATGGRIVAPPPARRAERRDRRRSDTADARRGRPSERPTTSVPGGTAAAVAPRGGPPAPPAAPAPAAPVVPRQTGDHVRQIGDSLSAAVQNTGSALADATQPLAPPVSAAVQQALNIVAEIVRRTTDGLGNTLDALLPRR